MTRLRRRGDDEGAALLLALAFLALFGVTAALLLQFVWGGFQTAKVTHSLNVNRTAANGAVDGAVNVLSRSTGTGVAGYSATCFNLPASTLQPAVVVQCLARSTSGLGSTTALMNQPQQAIYTNRGSAAEGYIQPGSTAAVIQGGVYANSTVSIGASSTTTLTNDALGASTTCSTPATGVSPACQVLGSAVDTGPWGARDPGYTVQYNNAPLSSAASPLVLATVPACPANKVVTLTPGVYRSAAALNALTGGACAGALVWFQPGVYDLDFADASDTWNLSDSAADVVGGTLTFTLPASRPSTVPFPTAASPTSSGCDSTKDGVVFVLSGDSRMSDTGSRVQLCAPPNGTTPPPADQQATQQQVAVWGPSDSTTNLMQATPPQSSTPSGSWTGKCSGAGDQIDPATGTLRHFAKVASQGNACSLPFTSTGLAALVPSDATAIKLSVSDSGDEQGSGYTTMTYTPPGSATSQTLTFSPNCSAGCSNETAFTSTVGPFTVTQISDLNSLALSLSVVNNNNAPISAWLDSPLVTVTWTEPAHPTSGAVATTGYSPTNSSTAAIVRASGAGRLSIHGTVYAPLAAVDLSETSVTNDIVDRGILARDVYLGTTMGSGFTGPVVSIPPITQNPRQLSLTAQIAGANVLRAEVKFTDSTGTVNGAVPHVLTWSQQ